MITLLLPLNRLLHSGAPRQLIPLTAALLLTATAPVSAQDETVPLVQDVRTLQIMLKTIGQEVTVKYAVDGNRIFYFPVFLLQEVKLPGGLPATDANGNLRFPPGDTFLNLTVTLLDLWKSRAYQDDLICTLTNHPVIRSITPAPQLLPAATSGQRRASLVFIDPNLANQRVILAESFLSDLADAQSRVTAQFLLDAQARARIAGFAGGVPIQAQHLVVKVEENYRARYTTTLALINLQSASESLAVMRQSLVPAPDRGQPTLLLSPNLPQLGTQAGSVVQDKQFTDQVRRFVRLQVLTREDSTVDPQLVDRLVSAALEQASLALQVSDSERQNAVATFLLEDGLTMSMALSEINELDVALHSASESEYRTALITSATKSQNTEVKGSAKVGFGPFSGSASAEVKQNWSRSDYVNRRMDDIKRQVHDANVHLSGNVRVLTGIRFSQSGTVQNVSFTSIEQSIGTFTLGDATILNTRSVQEYANLLNTTQQVEALRVPDVETGLLEPAWHSRNWTKTFPQYPGFVFRRVDVQFEKPFAEAPKLMLALNLINADGPAWAEVFTFADGVRRDGFTCWYQADPNAHLTTVRGSWMAFGKRSIAISHGSGGLASLGTPGLPPLIPAEARQAVLTPQLQSAPQIADGKFRASFNAIPGRTYQVESSLTLRPEDWSPLGTIAATDFLAGFDWSGVAADPQRFFRIMTP